MKALITSDIHIHKYRQFNQNNRRLTNIAGFVKHIFWFANQNNIGVILIAGDLFNNMMIINTEAVNAITLVFKECFAKYPNISVVASSGNHDLANKNLFNNPASSALEFLDIVFERFHLLDREEFVFNDDIVIWGIPYYEYPEDFRADLDYVVGILQKDYSNQTHFLLMHQMIGMGGTMIKNDIEPNDPLFDNFKMVFNGHIHEGGKLNKKFINIGSPMHRTASDIGHIKGFWTCDLTDISTLEFHDITDMFPQFVYKTIGEELTDWEKEQYVIFVPAYNKLDPEEEKVNENFNLTLKPAQLIENFCREVVPDEADKLNYGLKLVTS